MAEGASVLNFSFWRRDEVTEICHDNTEFCWITYFIRDGIKKLFRLWVSHLVRTSSWLRDGLDHGLSCRQKRPIPRHAQWEDKHDVTFCWFQEGTLSWWSEADGNCQENMGYLPAEVCHPRQFCLGKYKYEMINRSLEPNNLQFVSASSGNIVYHVEKSKRFHTVLFYYLSNGLFYLSLTNKAFAKYICPWIGVVSDGYILNSTSINKVLQVFKNSIKLDVICDRDEHHIVMRR